PPVPNALNVRCSNVVDVDPIHAALAHGDLDAPAVFPHLEQLDRSPFVFGVDFGLPVLPAEPGLILVRGARQYGSTWLEGELRDTIGTQTLLPFGRSVASSRPLLPRPEHRHHRRVTLEVGPADQVDAVRHRREDRVEADAHRRRLAGQVDDERGPDDARGLAREDRGRDTGRERRLAHALAEAREQLLADLLHRLGRDVARGGAGAAGRADEGTAALRERPDAGDDLGHLVGDDASLVVALGRDELAQHRLDRRSRQVLVVAAARAVGDGQDADRRAGHHFSRMLARLKPLLSRAIDFTEIDFGHTASHSYWFEQLPKPSASIWRTMRRARRSFSTWPCGRLARCANFAAVNSIAEPFLQDATQAPHEMQAA